MGRNSRHRYERGIRDRSHPPTTATFFAWADRPDPDYCPGPRLVLLAAACRTGTAAAGATPAIRRGGTPPDQGRAGGCGEGRATGSRAIVLASRPRGLRPRGHDDREPQERVPAGLVPRVPPGGATLQGGDASFQYARFDAAKLAGARLKGGISSFQVTSFVGADLTGATLTGGGASFQASSFEGATWSARRCRGASRASTSAARSSREPTSRRSRATTLPVATSRCRPPTTPGRSSRRASIPSDACGGGSISVQLADEPASAIPCFGSRQRPEGGRTRRLC